MMRYLALLCAMPGLVACSQQPPHTADDSSWVKPIAARPPAAPADFSSAALARVNDAPPAWGPPNTSAASAPTSMSKAPPAMDAPIAATPAPNVPNGMPQPEPL